MSAAGEPEVRSVVVRGLTIDGGLVFTTDMRSAKADAVHAGSPVALCVWFAEQELQVRLRGPAALLTSASGEWADVRRALWDEQRDAERRGVAGPPPGTRWTGAERPQAPEAPPASFGVAIVSPRRCELLRVGDPHVREVYAWSDAGGWVGGRVVP